MVCKKLGGDVWKHVYKNSKLDSFSIALSLSNYMCATHLISSFNFIFLLKTVAVSINIIHLMKDNKCLVWTYRNSY
jgi:hypothetical protein